jgi:Domain of unknown function (DUF4249)
MGTQFIVLMKVALNRLFTFCIFIILLVSCTTPFNPPAIHGKNQFLTVDGIVRNGQDSTIIMLSRSANLGDSAGPQPELNAQVTIVGQQSDVFPLINLGNGRYAINQLNLNVNQNYQLQITASNGEHYASDFVPVRQTPPIDSLNFRGDSSGVTIYVSTHDPLNNTRFYQWDFTQTWEHDSKYNSTIELLPGGIIVNRPADQQISRCWSSTNSTSILVTSSQGLSQDVVSFFPINVIDNGSVELSVEYSILVRQYALTQEAYQYWQTLKQNTELTGGLFQPQPSSVGGNFHCLTNTSEPVFGYFSVSSVDSMRIFINASQIGFWYYIPPTAECSYFVPPTDSLASYANYPTIYQPFIACNGPVCVYALAFRYCVDCTYYGGSNVKPPYWPF